MHIQRKNPQGKLVRCMRGRIFDVCLDLRLDSPTFMQWHHEILLGAKSMYCPPGTAHGFVALEPDSVIYYKCTTLYDKETDGGIYAFSQALAPHWPIPRDLVIMSEKDQRLPTIDQWLEDPRGIWK
jgi:dTDP-4-dehydrorhamnose 3,5-epimerase